MENAICLEWHFAQPMKSTQEISENIPLLLIGKYLDIELRLLRNLYFFSVSACAIFLVSIYIQV